MKGIYILVISVCEDIRINVGALGDILFEKGLYAYVGSAQGGLEKRIGRHLLRNKRKFWHIDYLLDNEAAKVRTILYKEADKSKECRIAGKLGERGVAVKNFGSSDCSCLSHLFRVEDYDFLRDFISGAQSCRHSE